MRGLASVLQLTYAIASSLHLPGLAEASEAKVAEDVIGHLAPKQARRTGRLMPSNSAHTMAPSDHGAPLISRLGSTSHDGSAYCTSIAATS